jgi:hypothetical protein
MVELEKTADIVTQLTLYFSDMFLEADQDIALQEYLDYSASSCRGLLF